MNHAFYIPDSLANGQMKSCKRNIGKLIAYSAMILSNRGLGRQFIDNEFASHLHFFKDN
jgi:hypothetical protein